MTPTKNKPKEKTSLLQAITAFMPVWVQIITCLGLVLVAFVSSPLWVERLFPIATLEPTATPLFSEGAVSSSDIVPTDTPPDPISAIVPSLCCLAGWDVFSSDGTSFPPSPQGDCSNIGIDGLGIHASGCGLVFGRDNVKQRGVFGLSMSIEHNITIRMTVTIINLVEGEFWVGFSNAIDPQAGSLIYAMTPDPGGVSVYFENTASPYARYRWADMAPDIGWVPGQPWQYKFMIELDGNSASVDVDGVRFASMVASSTDRLFIGYHTKPETIGTYLNATVSDLSITKNP